MEKSPVTPMLRRHAPLIAGVTGATLILLVLTAITLLAGGCSRPEADEQSAERRAKNPGVERAVELLNRGDAMGALTVLDSVEHCRQPSEGPSREVCIVKAYALSRIDSLTQARELVNRALAIFPEEEKDRELFRDYAYAAAVYYCDSTAEERVLDWCRIALEHGEACSEKPGLTSVLIMMGDIHARRLHVDLALDCYDRAIREATHPAVKMMALMSAARVYARYGMFEEADRHATYAVTLVESGSVTHPVLTGEALTIKGLCMSALHPDSAMRYYERADSVLADLPYNLGREEVDLCVGRHLLANAPGSSAQALERLTRCAASSEASDTREEALRLLAKARSGEHVPLVDAERMVAGRLASSLLSQKASLDALEKERREEERNAQLMRAWMIAALAVMVAMIAAAAAYLLHRHNRRARRHLLRTQDSLRESLDDARRAESHKQGQIDQILHTLNNRNVIETVSPFILKEEGGEDKFRERFDALHPGVLAAIRDRMGPLSPNESLLIMLIALRVDSSRIASLLSITPESVNKARYRLRKRLGLRRGESLDEKILSFITPQQPPAATPPSATPE